MIAICVRCEEAFSLIGFILKYVYIQLYIVLVKIINTIFLDQMPTFQTLLFDICLTAHH